MPSSYLEDRISQIPALRVDGFVRGAWKVEKAKGTATLTIEPFDTLTQPSRQALTDEGEQLVRFVEPDAKAYTVLWVE